MHDQQIVQFHGLQRRKTVLQNSSLYGSSQLLPEGMSNVLLESSSCGRCITTNRSGCREIVEDGVTGHIVEQKFDDLIEKLNALNLPYITRQWARPKQK